MHFDQPNLTKARILHLSEDIGHTWSSMVHDLDMVVHTDSPTSVVLLTAVHASGYNESGQKSNIPEVPFAFSDHIQHPAKVILPILGFFSWYQSHFGWMFELLKKSKPLQDDVYFPFKTVVEKKQLIFYKKQFASNGFDFVQKQRNQRKRQNKFDDDEKWIRSGDCPFTKAKRSNRDVSDQNELQTYASLENMLHKAIHVVRQLKKKGNTNTSSAPKQQSNSSSPSNSDLKTNVLSSDKSKAVKTTSKALSTRCFKCHRVGHYANKCQKQKSLVTLEKIETEPEKEDPLPIFDDYAHEPKEGK
ncbi:hypothetical protein F2Q70_00025993 [Brassica cretica]|uniref:CCHC-type domain-containing protein n=1 Tax=Brassica cretica TaxID=69181 RepID=A0A8S9LCB4_BRACR|nr:hypothetical protein F2Q70_00025993 [Brassica cretica]